MLLSLTLGSATLAALNPEQALASRRRAARALLRSERLQRFDERYQAFVRRNIDTLVTSKERLAQAEEFGEVVDPKEASVNRKLGLSVVSTAAAGVGVLGMPVVSALGMIFGAGAAGLLISDITLRYARQSWRERRLKYYFVGGAVSLGMLMTGSYVLLTNVAMIIYYAMFKVAARSEAAAHDSMRRAFGLQPPQTVWTVMGDVEVEIPFADLAVGDIVSVHAGQTIPIDGVVVDGEGTVDQQALTGEFAPAEKAIGDTALANTMLVNGRLHIKVEKTGADTAAAQIGAVLVQASTADLASTASTERLVDDLTPAMMLTSGLAFLLTGPGGAIAIFHSGMTTPLMSGPLNMLSYLNIASSNGILVKDGASLERLGKIDAVVFDKTGTLTMEQPQVSHIHTMAAWEEADILRLAAIAEHRQTHPIARAILARAEAEGIDAAAPDKAAYAMGMGVTVTVDGRVVRVGSARFLRKQAIALPQIAEAWRAESDAVGGSLVLVAVDDACIGAVRLEAQLRPETESLMQALKARGVKTYILSGDARGPTEHLGQVLGVDDVFAEVLPEDKKTVIERLQSEGLTVCFVGDGLNDALALQQADVSVSMRGATTLATDSAQIVLMSPSLAPIDDLFELGKAFERNLNRTLVYAYAPAGVVVGGVFLLGLGVPAAIALFGVGIAGSVASALAPMARLEKKDKAGKEGRESDR